MYEGPEEGGRSAEEETSGEYHYVRPEGQIYSDAHYVPQGESPDPPRYYAPPERQEKSPRRTKKKTGGGHAAVIAVLCAVCLLTGAFAGAVISARRAEQDISALRSEVDDMSARLSAAESKAAAISAAQSAPIGGITPAQIYAEACSEVVGITTPVTYTNFFGHNSSSAVTGSGFIIRDDGYILTNYHVIEYAAEYGYDVTVMLHDGSRYTADIVGTEEYNDIAVLKINASGIKGADLGDSEALSVGDDVFAIGNPLGELEFSMSTGHVSALDRKVLTEENGDEINMFQIDAAVNEGNSGGPVYNSGGRVIGVVTAKYSSTGVEGIGFAIPINDAKAIADELIEKGYVSGKADLGVTIDERYNYIYARWYNLPEGAYVSAVSRGGAAEAAGIREGDIIVSVDDTRVTSEAELNKAVRRYAAGDAAVITVYRSDGTLELNAVFGEKAA